ncbi:hypothetical protein B0H14DRAFT_3467870 [Mycena olivaceomarginata]|nr:hypothetical protein B0H14DRAFT_3467870 [Mycena olivaceomarginata]
MSTLSAQFTRGRKANQHQYRTYCNGCITKYKLDNPIDTSDMDEAEKFQALSQHTQDAVQDATSASKAATSSRKRLNSEDSSDAPKKKKPALRQTELAPVRGTEQGRALVRAEQTWRIGMAKWIGERRAEAAAEEVLDSVVDDMELDGEEEEEDPDGTQPEPTRLPRIKKWPQMTLAKLFKGRAPPPLPTRAEIEAQAERDAQNTAAGTEEDEIPDDGAVEIPSEDEYVG